MAFEACQRLPRAAERRSNFFPGPGTHLSNLVPSTAADHTVLRQRASILAPVSRLGTTLAVFGMGDFTPAQNGSNGLGIQHGSYGLETSPFGNESAPWSTQIGDPASGIADAKDGLQRLLGSLLLSSLDGSLENHQLSPEKLTRRPSETVSREMPFTPNLDKRKLRDFDTSFSTSGSASSSPEFTVSGLQLPKFQSIWSSESTPKVRASTTLTKTVIDEYLTPKLDDFRFVENDDPFIPFPVRTLSFSADNSVSASPIMTRTEISQPKEPYTTHLTPSSGLNFYLSKVKNATFVPSYDYSRPNVPVDQKTRDRTELGETRSFLKATEPRKSADKWPRGEELEKKSRKTIDEKEQKGKPTNKEKSISILERLTNSATEKEKGPKSRKYHAPKSINIDGEPHEIHLNLARASFSKSGLENTHHNLAMLSSLSDRIKVDENFCSTFYKRNKQGYMFIKESSSSSSSLKVNGTNLRSWVFLKVNLGHSGGPESARKVKVDTKDMPIWRPANGGASGGYGKRHGKKNRANVLKRFGRKNSGGE